MEYLTSLLSRAFSSLKVTTNFQQAGVSEHKPSIPDVNVVAIENHQRTLRYVFRSYLTSDEYDTIVNGYKRTSLDPETITEDFFSGDIPDHPQPQDLKSQLAIQGALTDLYDAWKPPIPAQPCHLYDIQWHYPFKWQVNAEYPFSVVKSFLKLRKPFSYFYDYATKSWLKYVNPADMLRRFGPEPSPAMLDSVTPAKFGYMKNLIFSFVHSWQHIIKSRFTSHAGLKDTEYINLRFIFPMLLHIKTAVVKSDAANKLRSIWGVSKLWIISEAMLYWEYIAWIKTNPGITPMLWGYETFTGGWFRLYRDLYVPGESVSYITIDWSRFDKRARFWLITLIFGVTRSFLDFNNGYVPTKDYPTSPTAPDKLQALWEWTVEAFFNSPIILPDGTIWKRLFAGIPSGLFITQLMDSWVNYVMICAILRYTGYDPKQCIIKVQGDDSLIRLYFQIPYSEHNNFLLQMQQVAEHLFGTIISFEKSEIRNSLNGVEVLSYRNTDGLPYRDLIKMLAQFYHTKAKDPTPEITMAQAIGFAYAACGTDYRVHKLLSEVYQYYKDQGFKPNPAGIQLTFGDSPDRPYYPIELDHFPDQNEVQRFLLATEYQDAITDERNWPRSHFLFAPCSRS
jgi:hypothetical protein